MWGEAGAQPGEGARAWPAGLLLKEAAPLFRGHSPSPLPDCQPAENRGWRYLPTLLPSGQHQGMPGRRRGRMPACFLSCTGSGGHPVPRTTARCAGGSWPPRTLTAEPASRGPGGQPGSCPCCHLAPHPPSEALEPTCPPSLSHSPGLRHPDSGAASSSKWSHAEPGPQPLGSAGQARGTQGTWDAATRVGRGRGVGRGKSGLGASCRAASPLGGSGLVQSGVVGLVTPSWNGPYVTEAS